MCITKETTKEIMIARILELEADNKKLRDIFQTDIDRCYVRRAELIKSNVRLRKIIGKISIALYCHGGWIVRKEVKAAIKKAAEIGEWDHDE